MKEPGSIPTHHTLKKKFLPMLKFAEIFVTGRYGNEI